VSVCDDELDPDGYAHSSDGPATVCKFASLYEMGAVLGKGSFALVKRAVRRADSLPVAVKCVLSSDEERIMFLRDEFQLLQTLEHPGIVSVQMLFESPLGAFMCMKLCNGGSLESFIIGRDSLSESDVRLMFVQLIYAVDYLHQKRITHRDLKPANMLLHSCFSYSPDIPISGQELKICDFNSARQTHSGVGGVMLSDRGTHEYTAPELKFGRLWNERVDIWACGMSLYFMLHAIVPFSIDKRSVAKKLLGGELPSIAWRDISDLMKNLVQQCLAVDMRDRPPAMELCLHPAIRQVDAYPASNTMPTIHHSCPTMSCENEANARAILAIAFHREFIVLSSSGLIVVPPCRATDQKHARVNLTDSSGTKADRVIGCQVPLTGDWNERRLNHNALRRVARNRTERTMNLDVLQEPQQEAVEQFQRKNRKSLTTHGALKLPPGIFDKPPNNDDAGIC